MLWRRSPYELVELLGEGSQGSVYRAIRHDRASGLRQVVAIKILHSRTMDLWRHEFESLSCVRSPFCVQVLSFERVRRSPALVLEYVEGVSLAQLGRTCWLDEREVQEVVAQIEQGLKDLAQQGLFHGDLSPQNVLLDRNGRVRLLDFGLANCVGGRVTPHYASPERLAGNPASLAADLYALGKIEGFLSAGECTSESYLASQPEKRHFQDLSLSNDVQGQLASKIQRLLQRKKQGAEQQTHTHAELRPKPQLTKGYLLATIIASQVLLLSSASHSTYPAPMATLTVRTQHWHYLMLNGRPLGYSPLSFPVEADQPLWLQWVSAKGGGEKTLRLKSSDNLILEDSDFSH
jgi:serine/threonine protein kinase